MIGVVQRVLGASVTVGGTPVGKIGKGLAILLAVQRDDGDEQLEWMAEKLVRLRIFPSEDGSKNYDLDVTQIGGEILLISNFTITAVTSKGRRPTLEDAADPDSARVTFDRLVAAVRARHAKVQTGRFGADMIVSIDNDGPSTFIVSNPTPQVSSR